MRERKAWIDAARGLALSFVVLLHVCAWVSTEGFGVSPWLHNLNLMLDGFRMPTLVMISGLLAAGVRTWPWADVLRRRVGPLAILYIVWAPIAVIVIGWVRDGAFSLELRSQLGLLIRPEQRMWYFYALALYIAGAYVLRRVPTVPLVGAAVVVNLVAVTWVLPAHLPLNFQWWGYVLQHWVFFVAAERLARSYDRVAAAHSSTNAVVAGGVFLAVGVVAIATSVATNSLAVLVLSVAGTAATLCVAPLVGHWRVLGWARAIGRRSLGVYAMHAMLSAVVVTVVAPALPVFKGAGILVPIAVAALVLAIAYGATLALDRWLPVPFLRVWWDTTAREPGGEPRRSRAQAQ